MLSHTLNILNVIIINIHSYYGLLVEKVRTVVSIVSKV
jgi:hypothetical protein